MKSRLTACAGVSSSVELCRALSSSVEFCRAVELSSNVELLNSCLAVKPGYKPGNTYAYSFA